MGDKELEQAVLAAFEAVLGSKHSAGLAPFHAGKESAADATGRELETLATEIQRMTAEPSANFVNASAGAMNAGSMIVAPTGTPTLAPAAPTGTKASPSPANESSGAGDSIVSTVLKTGLGAAPLVRLVAGLFGGGGAEAPPPLVKYAWPTAINRERANREAVDGRTSFAEFDYGQGGERRQIANDELSGRAYDPAGSGARQYADDRTAQGRASQITVNVQAMDSRSFLDHSDEIARAVREAMLNMHPLNDVVSDL